MPNISVMHPPLPIEMRAGLAAMDLSRVHAWLAAAYWAKGIARDRVEASAANSALVVGAFLPDGSQVGYARVISDRVRFAYLCDVIVDEAYRSQGVGRAMVRYAMEHPCFSTVSTWILSTRDAHSVYTALGFLPVTDPISRPEDWMVLRRKPPVPQEASTNTAAAEALSTNIPGT